jgi:hypothetical protein
MQDLVHLTSKSGSRNPGILGKNGRGSHTHSSHGNEQQAANQTPVQLPWIALVLWLGLEAGHAAALVVGVEFQMKPNGVVDAADETHAGVGLLFHDVFSDCCRMTLSCLDYSIDAGFEQTPLAHSSF